MVVRGERNVLDRIYRIDRIWEGVENRKGVH